MCRVRWGLALLLVLGLATGVGHAQTVTKIQMSKQPGGWGTGHSTPVFSTHDVYAYCKVEAEIPPHGTSMYYTLTLTWYAPDGSVYQTDSWDLERDAYYYRIYGREGKLAIRGTRAASLVGKWRVVAAIRFARGSKSVEFAIEPATSVGPGTPTPPSPTPLPRSPLPSGATWSQVIAWGKPAVVFIQADTGETDGQGNKLYSTGSGVIISPNGYILTAAHVIDGASKIEVLVEESRTYTASVVKVHPKWNPAKDQDNADVAMLKISATGLSALPLGNSDTVGYDEEIRVLGYPTVGLGFGFIAVAGTVQGQRVTHDGVCLLQHNAPGDKGHSGGPVINQRGEVIGIQARVVSSRGGEGEWEITRFWIAVSVNTAKEIIPAGVAGLGEATLFVRGAVGLTPG